MNLVTVGVLGQSWRAAVTPWGAIEQWDGLGTIDWFIAADDRWYQPAHETTVRQTVIDGTPVVETRVRIPQGDAVQRVYAVADHGGLTIIEIENDSSLPIAVAFTGAALLSQRPPTDLPVQGIDLPSSAVSFPVGHRSTVTVAVRHESPTAGLLPSGLPTALQVSRGWLTMCERASRLVLPDEAAVEALVRERCELLLCGPDDPAVDAVGFLIGVGELVRLGSQAEPWVPEVADAVAALVGHAGDPDLRAALDGAERVCVAAGEMRAARDLDKVRQRLLKSATVGAMPAAPAGAAAATGARSIARTERIVADGADLFSAGIPTSWLGMNIEVHALPTGPASAVSFAVRWHGERPAVLWEQSGAPVALTASSVAPGWSTTAATGETLWPAPVLPDGITLADLAGEAEPADESGPTGADRAAAMLDEPSAATMSTDGDVSFG